MPKTNYQKAMEILKRGSNGPKVNQRLQKKFDEIESKIETYTTLNPDIVEGRSLDDVSLILDVLQNVRNDEYDELKNKVKSGLDEKTLRENEIDEYEKLRREEYDRLFELYEDDPQRSGILDTFDKETEEEVERKQNEMSLMIKQRAQNIEYSTSVFNRNESDYANYVIMKKNSAKAEREYLPKVKENLSHVLDMRQKARDAYYATPWYSRLARWVLPNAWSDAGNLQNEIDEYNKAITDSGFSMEQAEAISKTEMPYGEKLNENQYGGFKDLYDYLKNSHNSLDIGHEKIGEVLNLAEKIVKSNGKIYDGFTNLLDEISTKIATVSQEVANIDREDLNFSENSYYENFENFAKGIETLTNNLKNPDVSDEPHGIEYDVMKLNDFNKQYDEHTLNDLEYDVNVLNFDELSKVVENEERNLTVGLDK